MEALFLHLLASYGLWFVVTQSHLPVWHGIRDALALKYSTFGRWLLCAVCSGFWCSLAVASALAAPELMGGVTVTLVGRLFVQALAGAATCYLVEAHVTRLEAR